MPFAFERGSLRAGYAGDQQAVDGVTEHREDRAGQQNRNKGSDHVAEGGLYAERREEIERRVHPEHHEVALGEIDDPHHAEYESEPDAHQAVDRADQKSGGQGLQKAFDELGHRRSLWIAAGSFTTSVADC